MMSNAIYKTVLLKLVSYLFSLFFISQSYVKFKTTLDKCMFKNKQLLAWRNQYEYQKSEINNCVYLMLHSLIYHRQHWLVTIVL